MKKINWKDIGIRCLKTLSYQGQTNITSNTITMFDVEAYQSTKLILENLDSRLTL